MTDTPYRKELEKLQEYVAGKNIEDIQTSKSGKPLIKLASNENPLGPSPKALAAIQKNLAEISVYPDQNCLLLREAIAKHYLLRPENILIGNGSDEIMLMVGLAFLSAGEESLISRGTFSVYEYVTTLLGGKSSFVDHQNGKYDWRAFLSKITTNARIVWIANPNNPTGTYITTGEMNEFLAKVPKSSTVVLDEAYAEYATASDFPKSTELLGTFPNLIILRTFSKAYGLAGLRVGYAIASKTVIQILNKTRLPFNVNRVAQTAALAALEDIQHLEKSKKNNAEGKLVLESILQKKKLKYYPTEANFIWIGLPKGLAADNTFMEFLRRGIIIRPLTSFGMPGAIRVTIGTPDQNKRFGEALEEIVP